MRKKLSHDFLLSELKRYYELFGKTPTSRDLNNNNDFPSSGYYRHGFGSYSNAIILSGLPYTKKIVASKEMREKTNTSIVEDYLRGLSINEIATKNGYANNASISNIIKNFDIDTRNTRWTKDEISYLKENYATLSSDEMSEKLNKSKKEMNLKAYRLGLKKEINFWSSEEIIYLEKNYKKIKNSEIAYALGKSVNAISGKAIDLGLTQNQHWTQEEDEMLLQIHSDLPNDEIAKVIGKTRNSIVNRASILKLKKSKKYWDSLKEFDEDTLLIKLINVAESLKRTPTQKDLIKIPGVPSSATYRRYFGSYAKACVKAGLEVNNQIFGTSHVCESINGDICLSSYERIISNLFIVNDIAFKKEVLYSEIIDDKRCGLKRMDWLLGNKIVVEFFGMPDKKYYSKRIDEKIKLCDSHNIVLISLYPSDLLQKNRDIFANKFYRNGIHLKMNKDLFK